MNADPQPPADRVVSTEFGEVVFARSTHADDPGRCWRCDVAAGDRLDDIGLCPPCGRELRGRG